MQLGSSIFMYNLLLLTRLICSWIFLIVASIIFVDWRYNMLSTVKIVPHLWSPKTMKKWIGVKGYTTHLFTNIEGIKISENDFEFSQNFLKRTWQPSSSLADLCGVILGSGHPCMTTTHKGWSTLQSMRQDHTLA